MSSENSTKQIKRLIEAVGAFARLAKSMDEDVDTAQILNVARAIIPMAELAKGLIASVNGPEEEPVSVAPAEKRKEKRPVPVKKVQVIGSLLSSYPAHFVANEEYDFKTVAGVIRQGMKKYLKNVDEDGKFYEYDLTDAPEFRELLGPAVHCTKGTRVGYSPLNLSRYLAPYVVDANK